MTTYQNREILSPIVLGYKLYRNTVWNEIESEIFWYAYVNLY